MPFFAPHGVRLTGLSTLLDGVSTHAPARGATLLCINCRKRLSGFNPRTRTGCDGGPDEEETDSEVSTHAPARGATPKTDASVHIILFQPTHPHGVRLRSLTTAYLPLAQFQPTHPHGVRLIPPGEGEDGGTCFNPRTRTGCDTPCLIRNRCRLVSTHAPARGATGALRTSRRV